MGDCDINVLVHAGSQALVRVTCKGCEDVTLLKLVMQTGEDASEEAATPAEPVRDAGRPQGVPALSADDVLDAKLALDAWDGDISSLLGPSSQP